MVDPHRNRWRLFAAVGCGTMMAAIDLSIINLALPSLKADFQVEVAQLEWVVLIYLLTVTVSLLTAGRLADLVGRSRFYNMGFAVFVTGSVLCGLAPGLAPLVASRALQAIGAAMLISSSQAILLDGFPVNQRGRALGLNSTIFAIGAMVGPTLGGFLLTHFSWRAVFLINVPVCIAGMIAGFRYLPKSAPRRGVTFDFPGALLLLTGMVALLLAINFGQHDGWTVEVILLSGAAVILGTGFLAREATAAAPLLRLGLFRAPGFSAAMIAQTVVPLCSSGILIMLPFFLVGLQGRTPAEAGLILLASPLTNAVSAPIGGMLSDRFDVRYVATAGMSLVALGYLMYSFISLDWTPWRTVLCLVVTAIGTGLFMSPNTVAAYRFVAADERGVASAAVATLRNFGMTTGAALAVGVWTLRSAAEARTLQLDPGSALASVAGLRDTFVVMIGLAMIGVAASILRPKGPVSAAAQP